MSKPGNGQDENAFFIHLIEGHNIGSDHILPHKSVVPSCFQVKPASEMIYCSGWLQDQTEADVSLLRISKVKGIAGEWVV